MEEAVVIDTNNKCEHEYVFVSSTKMVEIKLNIHVFKSLVEYFPLITLTLELCCEQVYN